ncbi:MAG: hypothetical protein H6774_02520 [Pseudomonadales bacterium]|nr:hypothetical protein [Candidatus Woesebacteria bacterium]MCB9801938.1 hypothetical protein [Pseudomonadales bacterium]
MSYPMILITLIVWALFMWAQFVTRLEPTSANSGANFGVTAVMVLAVLALASFITIQVSVDERFVRVKFGYGLFRKRFLLSEIKSAKVVKSPWYYGWGIHYWLWPQMWIYSISGLDAVEIVLKNEAVYRIGSDEVEKLEAAMTRSIT